jgi:heme-degrading monooxygenase HmoA
VIRVIYRWSVGAGSESDFLTWWHDGTMSIRNSHDGAMGSTLLRSTESPTTFVAVARWRSRDHLARFRRTAGVRPFADAALESIEVLEEIDDLTVHG